jgi:Lysozyme like domain
MASAADVAGWARNAGWSGKDLIVAVAVALAESGGNPNALGDKGLVGQSAGNGQHWGPSVGLWQIRSIQEETGKGTLRDERALVDPQSNANHAHAIWQQSGWGPWSTHNNQSYLLWMPTATAAVGVAGTSSAAADATSAVTSSASATLSVAEEPIKVLKWLTDPGTVMRAVKLAVGVGLILGAVHIVVDSKLLPVAEGVVGVAGRAKAVGVKAKGLAK